MSKKHKLECVDVNAHLHTPYSFSAFDKLTDALDRAVNENVKVVGINDFYSMDGYKEWNDGCIQRKLFPLFNIEFISLQEEDQAAGIRVNDPNNPGRTYLSGKGLAYPIDLPEPYASQLANVRAESNAQVKTMCGKLNDVLASYDAPFRLDFDLIEKTLTKGSIRERHLAKALRIAAYAHFNNDKAAIAKFFETIFGCVRSWEATDFSAEMIRQAKKQVHSSRLHFSVQDATKLPYGPESFDAVVISNALHVMPHPEKALAEAWRVLKPGGCPPAAGRRR